MNDRPWRICLIGNLSGPQDEAMKKTAYTLGLTLARNHEVLLLHLKDVFSSRFWLELERFRPEIIFYIGGPSFLTFVLAKIIRVHCIMIAHIRPRVVIFALHPSLPAILSQLSRLIRPDLILVQALHSQRKFQRLGMQTRFLPIGVELSKFSPVHSSEKNRLRQKYGLGRSDFVVLHVGSVRKNRGLEVLTRVQMKGGNRVLIIGSTSMPMDHSVYKKLTESGCLVWRRNFKNIEEIYQLADLYAFPVVNMLGSIELPLSVIEAMACNLPVILTRYGALPRILREQDGIVFVDRVDEMPLRIEQMKTEHLKVETRERAIAFSWNNVTETLTKYLSQLFKERQN